MEKTLNDLLDLAKEQVGYLEKSSNYYLDNHTENSGYGNFTKYSRDVNNAGLSGYQGCAWCITFQFWLDLMTFGKKKALELWNMTEKSYVGYNCFATYNVFSNKGKVGKIPKLGSLVIFTYSHAGRVIDIYTKNGTQYIDVIEGNTSSTTVDERNGGCVAIKTRKANDSVIKGYCYIDYDEIEENTEFISGWIQSENGWKFLLGDSQVYITNDWWLDSNGQWSYFDENSYAKYNSWFKVNGEWYYAGEDCYCLTSQWLKSNDKWYYLTADGSMARDSLIKAKDVGNELYYFVDSNGVWDGKSYVLAKDYPIVI